MFNSQDWSRPRKGALSLQELAKKSIVRRINTVYNVGTTPPHLLSDILSKVPNARQLREIEKSSPQVTEITKDCWIRLIRRDFPDADVDAYVPNDDSKWYKVYAKHAAEHAKREKEETDKLREQYNALKNSKEQHKTVMLNKAPYMPRRGGTGIFRRGDPNVRDIWHSAAGSRTKNLLTKIKREMAEQKIFVKPKTAVAQPRINKDLKEKLVSSIPDGIRKDFPFSSSQAMKRKEPPTSSSRPSEQRLMPKAGAPSTSGYKASSERTGSGISPPPAAARPSNVSGVMPPAGNGPVLVRKTKEANCFMPPSKKPKIGPGR